ncbi:MAG: GNAT family N-acetyltransferase [Opitutales bacterium]|nr:GNAT family N-acetyltransferase [Opitutales bacterium]
MHEAPPFTVDSARFDELADVLQVQKLAFAREAERTGDWQLPALVQTLEELQDDFASMRIIVARAGAEVVGSVRARIDENACAQVGRLVVRPDWQKRGVGSALLREIEAALPEARTFRLFTEERSLDNIRLYERNGYAIYARRRESDKVSFVLMEKLRP